MNKIIELNESLIKRSRDRLEGMPFSKITIKLKAIAALDKIALPQ